MDNAAKQFYCFNPSCKFFRRVFTEGNIHEQCSGWFSSLKALSDAQKYQTVQENDQILLRSFPIQNISVAACKREEILSHFANFFDILSKKVNAHLSYIQDQITSKILASVDQSAKLYEQYKKSCKKDRSNCKPSRSTINSYENKRKKENMNDFLIPSENFFNEIINSVKQCLNRVQKEIFLEKQPINEKEKSIQNLEQFNKMNQVLSQKNLSTVSKLYNVQVKNVYNYNLHQKVNIECHFCDWTEAFQEESAKKARKLASEFLINHLISNHPKTLEYNYTHHMTEEKVKSISLPQMFSIFSDKSIEKVIVLDRTENFFYNHKFNEKQPSQAIEICGHAPHSKTFHFLDENNKHFFLILGIVIKEAVNNKKKITIMTNIHKKQIIDGFCIKNGIENIETEICLGRQKQKESEKQIISENANEEKKIEDDTSQNYSSHHSYNKKDTLSSKLFLASYGQKESANSRRKETISEIKSDRQSFANPVMTTYSRKKARKSFYL